MPAPPNLHEQIRTIIEKYSRNFRPHQPGSNVVQGHVIALSGATGNIGSLILDVLLKTKAAKKIYILHRDEEDIPKERIARLLEEKGIDPTSLDRACIPVVYLHVDFSKAGLGLASNEYQDLRDNVTHIIHSAWLLKFTAGLDGFVHTHIAGVRYLVDLALTSPQRQTPRLVFLSTMSSAVNYRGPFEAPLIGEPSQYLVPEAPVDDPSMPFQSLGYAISKYIAERIIVNATQAGLRATISRVGQLGGMSTNGHWGENEYIAIFLRLILTTGICPTDIPPLRLLPCDVAASALVKQSFVDIDNLQYFSIENPFTVPWVNVQKILDEMSPRPFKYMPFLDILRTLENLQVNPETAPAIRLIEFFKQAFSGLSGFSALGWNKSVKIAPELASCSEKVMVDMARGYIAYILRQSAGGRKLARVPSAKL